MEFVINSTMMTATGLLAISIWTLIGYAITRFWCYLNGNTLTISVKTVLGIFGGPITVISMAVVVFLNLIPNDLFN